MADSDDETDTSLNLSRRDFTKAAGVGGVLAAVADPTTATPVTATDAGLEDAIEESFTPTEWLTVGPFQFQRRDLMSDWLTPAGGEQTVSTTTDEEIDTSTIPSELAAGGLAEWRTEELDAGSTTVPLTFSDLVDPTGEGEFLPLTGDGLVDNHQAWYGYGGVLLTLAYAVATFERDSEELAVLETDASQIWVNGRAYDDTPVGVVLQEGQNTVLVKQTTTLGDGQADVEFRPPEAPVEISSIERVPDLREGEQTDRPAAVRVTNTTPERQTNVTLELAPEEGDLIATQTVDLEEPLAPFETRMVNTRVRTTRAVSSTESAVTQTTRESVTVDKQSLPTTHRAEVESPEESETVQFKPASLEQETRIVVTVTTESDSHQESTGLTVRQPGDEVVTTYQSQIDESVQQFGYREPANIDTASGPFEAVHFLHGAGVDADSAAGSIAAREDLYVIAPETRGPVAFDHEDIGRLDDLEALEVAQQRFNIDPNQIYLVGHSMGGHGTWHIGTWHAERYAALGPQHSWPDHESYVIVPYKRDRLHTHPNMWSAREISLYKNLAGPNTENLADGTTPVFALHGGRDDETPPLMPRNMLRMLRNRGLSVATTAGDTYSGPGPEEVDVSYLEVPDADHWWDKDIGPGTDAVNHPDQFEWLRSTSRDQTPREVQFYTVNLDISHTKYWLGVLQQQQANTPTRVSAEVDGNQLEITTENVAVLQVGYDVFVEYGLANELIIDDEPYSFSVADLRLGDTRDFLDDRRTLRNMAVTIDLEAETITRPDSGAQSKRSGLYGPMRHVHYDPYRIVYGTAGDESITDISLSLANLRSHRLVDRARAPAPVIRDVDVTENIKESYNLILIGTPETNRILAEYNDAVPISVGDETVTVGDQTYEGEYGVQYVYPTPDQDDQLLQVVTGTSMSGLRLNELVNWIPTHTPSPDYMIFDDDFRFQGFNACLAAGYFDRNWELENAIDERRNR